MTKFSAFFVSVLHCFQSGVQSLQTLYGKHFLVTDFLQTCLVFAPTRRRRGAAHLGLYTAAQARQAMCARQRRDVSLAKLAIKKRCLVRANNQRALACSLNASKVAQGSSSIRPVTRCRPTRRTSQHHRMCQAHAFAPSSQGPKFRNRRLPAPHRFGRC